MLNRDTGNIAILYKGLGLSDSISLVVSGAYITWACVCNFTNATFLDRLGRINSMRMLLSSAFTAHLRLGLPSSNAHSYIVIGFSGGAIVIAIEAALIATYAGTGNHAGLSAAVAMLFAYIST